MEKTNTSPIIDKLFSTGAHFGYSKSRRHPSVSRFLFGAKGSVELFDLEHTAELLEAARIFLRTLAMNRGAALFVSSKAEARVALESVAHRVGAPYVSSRWIGGTLTNWQEIKKRLARLADLTDMRDRGELAKFTKLERLLIDREIEELDGMFGGLRGLDKPPAALVVVDPRHEKTAVTEAKKMGIPVVALLNSDCDAAGIAYPIPGNDASRQTIAFVVGELADAYDAGRLEAPAPVLAEAQ